MTNTSDTDPAVGFVAEARNSFQRFVAGWTPPEVVEEEETYLEDLLAGWLYEGPGIEATAADYDHFLQAVLGIIDGVLAGAIRLDYEGTETTPFARRLVALLPPKRNGNVLSRVGFDQLVHETLEGRRSEELTREVQRVLRQPRNAARPR